MSSVIDLENSVKVISVFVDKGEKINKVNDVQLTVVDYFAVLGRAISVVEHDVKKICVSVKAADNVLPT